ncbi:MAG: DUF1194 domain-containing protein [Alphaproteobacteria bacterium]
MAGSRVVSFIAALAVSAVCWTLPARAADIPVDLELVLSADVSRSVDDQEFLLQRRGYAEAFRDKRVIDAIRSGGMRRIAVVFVEWAAAHMQQVVIDWTLLEDAESAYAFAEKLESLPRAFFLGGGTAIGEALLYSAKLFDNNGFEAERRVIDLSGDGRTRNGMPAAPVRDFVVAQGIVINGLPILGSEPFLAEFYQSEVIGGPGAFSMPAEGFEDFANAVRSKLIREIAGRDDFRPVEIAQRDPAPPSADAATADTR